MNNTKIFPHKKYFICIVFVFFIKLFRARGGGGGGGGGGSLIIKHGKDVSNFLSVFPYSLFLKLCALV